MSDHLVSTTLLNGQSGQEVARLGYRPYGDSRYATGAPLTSSLYTGQRWDSALGLYDYRARYYHPVLGRFVSADPVVPEPGNPQLLNRYAYGGNNPVLHNDPDGHCGPLCASALLVGTIVVLAGVLREVLPPFPNTVARAADIYGVPYPIVAGVLDAERALDTQMLDYVETTVYDLAPIGVIEQIVTHKFPNPGPGPGNIHVETARSVSAYFAEYYPAFSEMQLGIHELSVAEITKRLADREFNVKVATAYVRELADYRFGANGEPLLAEHKDLSQWTLVDAVAVWDGYRYGIQGVAPPGQGEGMSLRDFQNRAYDLDTLVQVAWGVDKEISMYDSLWYFLRYVPAWR